MRKNFNTVGFVGLSHLGLTYLAAASEKGIKVVGYHDNRNLINNLKNNKCPIMEPGLKQLLNKNKNKINFTFDIFDLRECDLVFISQDVHTNKKNKSDLSKINYFVNKLRKILKSNSTLVILSQVSPGYTEKVKWKKKNLYYQVETLIFGNAVERALNPDRIIVGSYRKNPLNKIYNSYIAKFRCPIFIMDYVSAELCKISINMFLASSVSTTNALAELCEKIGASWSNIYPAIQRDKRIGKYSYLRPGLGISGGNLERDIYNITNLANKFHSDKKIFKSFIHSSARRKNWVYETLKKFYLNKKKSLGKIGILGLSYKQNTNSTKNSPAINLINKIKRNKILAYDPKASDILFKKNVKRCFSIKEVLSSIDVLVICTPWSEFRGISASQLLKAVRKKIIIDPFQIFNKDKLIKEGFIYKSLGEY